jgi:hypothetical protein
VELSDRSLEAELATIAENAEPGRTAQLAVRHWGWDGRGGATLEATGRELGGITRERVRQLCERLAQRVGGEPAGAPAAPALDRALVLAAHAAPTTAHELARQLADEHIAARSFDPAGLLTAAAVLGRDTTFRLGAVKDVRVVLPDPPDPASDTVAVIARVVDTARALVRRSGAARIGDVTGRVAAELAVWVDDALVTAVVSEPDDFIWLERRSGWFYLPSVAKNAVVSRVAKVLSITGAVRLADLHAGIRRDERMKEFVMPEYILAELCERMSGVHVAGDVVSAAQRLRPEDVLEATELTLLRLLVASGGEADRHELERACLETGMKASSFNSRIAYSPIITELGHGRYGLRGLRDHGTGIGPAAAWPGRTRELPESTPRPGELAHFRPSRGR